jgi:opacity protein-like surface antigen
MRKIAGVVLGLVLALACAPVAARAQDGSGEQADDFSLTVGGRGWVTWGYTKWSTRESGISPASEREARGADAVVPELYFDAVWGRLVMMVDVGARELDEGVLRSEQYAASGRQFRFDYTRSNIEADDEPGVAFGSIDIGGRVLRWKNSPDGPQGYLDYFVGYQYWRERYDTFGAHGFFDPCLAALISAPCPTSTSFSSATNFATDELQWHSVRAGLRTQVPIAGPLSLRAKATFLPYNWIEIDETLHTNGSFQQDPSIHAFADGGFGMQLEGGLTINFVKGLSMEMGYRWFSIESPDGDAEFNLVSGTVTHDLRRAETERHGPYLGLEYRF